MLTLPASVRVFVARGATDLRRSFDRLSAQVQEVLRQDPLSGHVFVFFNRQRNRVKMLVWERDVKLPRFRRWCWREEEGEDPMPRTHQPYAAEYRRRIIELARAGRSINELAREFEPSANAIREWVKQAALDEGLRSDGLTTTEREELTRLRRENRMLREEREILAKAAAWCVSRT
jgi:transposase